MRKGDFDGGEVYAPWFVVNPGEHMLQAMERHRRETGYKGPLFVAAVNRRPPGAGTVTCHAAVA